MNRKSGILVIVHSISLRKSVCSHNQLLSLRSNGQPLETSHLGTNGAVWFGVNLASNHADHAGFAGYTGS